MKSKRVYFYATLVTISVILINQAFIQYWLHQKKQDANIINISGRQRMLSQRILALQYAYQASPNPAVKEEIKKASLLWVASQDFLLKNFQAKRSTPQNDSILQQLKALGPFIKRGNEFTSQPPNLNQQQLQNFKNNQEEYLYKMDTLVSVFEEDSEFKLTLVIVIEIFFALCSLLLIYYEITFIFRRINQDLSAKNVALEESNKLLEQYAYLAAHDLKSPIQNVINFAKVLRQQLADRLQEVEKEYFSYILDSAERLKRTTNDLLQFSTINHEKVNIEVFAPQVLFEEILKDLNPHIQEKKAIIHINQMPDKIMGDRHLLHLVFQNLIANSLKFTKPDEPPQIEVNYQNKEAHHVFAIKDNGVGIAAKDQDKIFGLFKRLHRHESFQGTGIGLSICQKIMEKHQGSIYVESQIQEGSTFYTRLPKQLE